MDVRRAPRAVIDPKLRRVGFFDQPEPETPPIPDSPPSDPTNSVLIPPPRLLSERTAAVPVPESRFRRQELDDQVQIGSYNPSESVLGTSPTASIASSGVGIIDGEFSEDCSRVRWLRGSDLSFRGGRLDLKNREILEESVFSAVAVNLDNLPRGICML